MVYKMLLTHQIADQLAENDKVFNDLLTAVADFANFLQFDNTKGIKGEVAAGGTYKSLVVLDASNIVQLGQSGTEVRVPADPSNALGVATKQYADGVQMFRTQAKVSASSGTSGAYLTILNQAATTRGRIKTISMGQGTLGPGTVSVRITIDGGSAVTITSSAIADNNWRGLLPGLLWSTADQANENLTSTLIHISFNTSILIEATSANANAATITIVYEKIP